MEEIKIPYWIQKKSLYKYIALCLIAGIGMAFIASTNERGVVILGFIHLSTPHATIFYWALSNLIFILMIASVFTYIRGERYQPHIIIGEESFSAPTNPLAFKTVSIAYKDIDQIKVARSKYGSAVTIKHVGGKLSIGDNIIGKELFDQIAIILEKKHTEASKNTPYDWNY